MLKLNGLLDITVIALCLGLSFAAQADPVVGRYVRVELIGEKLNGEPRFLSLAEVDVFDSACPTIAAGCASIAAGKPASQTPGFDHLYPASNAVNGLFDDFTHTGIVETQQRYHWWEVDLGSDTAISHLRVKNRSSCCGERINPARILVLDKDRNLIWLGAINSTADNYVFENIAKPATQPQTLNLLLNTTFTKRTNPGLPDEWGVHKGFAQNVADAQNLYFVSDSSLPPAEAPNVKVVELHNPTGYSYLYFLPTSLVERRPAGKYTFSFYLKADADQPFWIHKGFDTFDTEKILKTASTQWQRFSTTFDWSGSYRDQGQALDPVIHLPSAGTYYIAAPQLEEGSVATPFHLAAEDFASNPPKYIDVGPEILAAANNPPAVQQPVVKSVFEHDYYTGNDANARLRIMASPTTAVDVKCAAANSPNLVWSKTNISVNTVYDMGVSLSVFPVGQKYKCAIYRAGSGVVLSTSEFQRLPANSIETRANRFNGGLTLKTATQTKLFYIQGMDLYYTAPQSYFQDLKDHGINTVVYFGALAPDLNTPSNNYSDLNNLLAKAANVGLKVIVGVANAGKKTDATGRKLTEFYTLVDAFKGNSTIIGWYPLDEPDTTWNSADLIEIYTQIKQRDPYRFVFVNWTAHLGVGEEPLNMSGVLGSTVTGALGATDFYSRTGCYPFFLRKDMDECTNVSLHTQRTARLFNKATHNWLQIFGYGDAWREPTLAEFRYMAYLSVLYGSTYSYFGTKSLSAYTWANIGTINSEANWLATSVFYDKTGQEIIPPRIDPVQKNFIYSVWKKGPSTCFVTVVHNDNPTEDFRFDPKSCFPRHKSIKSWFEAQRTVSMTSGLVQEAFLPYQTRVYVIAK